MAPVAAIATVVQVGANIYQGHKESETAKINSDIAKREAERQNKLTGLEIDRHWRHVQRILSAQPTAAVASGITATSISVQASRDASIKEAVFDAELIKMGGAQKVQALLAQAENFGRQADAAPIVAGIKAGTSLLAGAEKTYSLIAPGGSDA